MQLELELRPALPSPPVFLAPAPRRARRSPLLELVEAFLISSVDNAGTQRNYRAALAKAFDLMKVTAPAEVSLARLAALRAAIVGSGLASSTQAGFLCAVRAFFGWSCLVEAFPHLSLDAIRRVLRLPRVQTVAVPQIPGDDELPVLFARAPVANGMRAMLAVFLGGGLRVAELCALDRGDLHVTGADGLLLVRGKGGKDRLVPVHPPVVCGITAYLEMAERTTAPSSSPLFVAHDPGAVCRGDNRISTRSVRRRLARLLRAAGITRRMSVHSLRHKFASAMVEDGVDLNRIRAVLGHASLATTQRYIDHITSHQLRAAVPARLVPTEAQFADQLEPLAPGSPAARR